MLQQFFAWIKSLFSKSSPIHHEDNGLWWQQTGTIVKVGLSTEIIKELATITFLDTPRIGEKVTTDSQLIDIEGGKAVETFKSPVNGIISRIASNYQSDPASLTGKANSTLLEIKIK